MNAAVNADELRSGARAAALHTSAASPGRVSIRVLSEDEWSLYRPLLQEATQDSLELLRAAPDRETTLDEPDTRPRLLLARRLVAELNGVAVGVVSVNAHRDDPTSSNLTGLWVAPAVRNRGIGTLLAEAAAALEAEDGKKQLYYWVSTDNASAIAFASNTGFRITSHRRSTGADDQQPNGQEVAFVMPLETDPGAVPNASSAP